MKVHTRIRRSYGLIAAVAALAASAPAASAHDETSVGGSRTPGGTTFKVPVPSLPLPSFEFELDGRKVDSSTVPAAIDGGTLIVSVSGASTSPQAVMTRHCAVGDAGMQLSIRRSSPGAVATVLWDAGAPGGTTQTLATHTIAEGGRPTEFTTGICQGL